MAPNKLISTTDCLKTRKEKPLLWSKKNFRNSKRVISAKLTQILTLQNKGDLNENIKTLPKK